MTLDEAIKLIRGIEEDGRNVTSEHVEALNLAIKALETMEMIKKHYILIEKGVRDNPDDLMIGRVMGEKE